MRLCFVMLLSSICIGGCRSAHVPLTFSDLRDADGWYVFPAFKYRGPLQNGLPQGRGEVRYPSGVHMEGTFVRGTLHGPATVTVPGYGTFAGTMNAGNFARGQAQFTSGAQYAGAFSNWQFSGMGTLVQADGVRLNGTFSNGRLHGEGIRYEPATGTVTQGTFRNGAPHGPANVTARGATTRQYFDGGQNVTAAQHQQKAAAALTAPYREEVAAKQEAKKQAQERDNSALRAYGRMAKLRTQSGVDDFNKECSCLYEASLRRDGSVHVAPDGMCLEVISKEDRDARDRRVRTMGAEAARRYEEQQRAEAERRKQRRRDECRRLSEDFTSPDFPARLAAMRRHSLELSAEAQRAQRELERAEQALARAEAEARQAQSARIQAELRRQREQANAEALRQAQQRNQECTRTPQACKCAIITWARPDLPLVKLTGHPMCQ